MVRYPSRNGIALPTSEIVLPTSKYPDRQGFKNNHHLQFEKARYIGGGVLYLTLRDLDRLQYQIPKDVHNAGKDTLHTRYSAPVFPTPSQAIDCILEAYQNGESLRFGSAREPEYVPLTEGLVYTVQHQSFQDLRRRTDV